MDFHDHYELVEDHQGNALHHTLTSALLAASGDQRRIWFVRETDGPEDCACDEDCDCELDTVWSVESWHGQFVNFLGFFVSTEPCKPEHKDALFDY